jgi:hypothetical protein
MPLRRSHRLALAAAVLSAPAVLVAAAHAPRVAGPPWISIEYPANPLDPSTRGAFLLVHAFHHGTPMQAPVRGTAEGLVNGERRTVALRFETTSRPGVYALRKQWSDGGVWSLVIAVVQGEQSNAEALVEIAEDGGISSVRVPTRREREWTIPRAITAQEVEQSLRGRAATRTAQSAR